ncbi:DEAD/DEAH box helicase [Pseudobacteriovorax antillogorgiicola]|uniref:Superfamily II DNA or RNA helicase, SNF2 family n=1 Tax=Pseudobacteriovorax antillogorgiicola TaxID=1513793 RepID=A0A1Y6CDP5_9BACT|nr:DEAD/DEAH box helicase [Pseudobacteriovorax antillogorgiicola]TCS51768.1 SNF2 family DNA or RNA helicase [Pseudobacteriovorax antillogorgiicola]SMF49833.1 Superfamily II DNA or RNA helicase, SNF2 family [Pseudobacteriovorax antillogorgiicola]
MKYDNLLIPDEYLEDLISLLERELEKEYPKTKVNKGRRLLDNGIQSLGFEGEEGFAEISERGEIHQVSMTLPIFDLAGGYSVIKCTCLQDHFQLEPERCHHMWAAQHGLLDGAKARLEEKQGTGNSVESLFATLEAVVEAEDNIEDETLKPRLLWQLSKDFELSPVALSAGRGRAKKKVLGWSELLRRNDLWQGTVHQPLMTYVRVDPGSGHALVDHFSILLDLAKMLDAPVQNEDGDSISVDVMGTALIGKNQEDGLIVQPRFHDGTEIQHLDAEGGAVSFATATQVLLAPLNPKQFTLMQKLIEQPVAVPSSDKDRLFQYLSKLSDQIPVSMDRMAEGEAADDRLILRLIPFESGAIKGEVWVKPSPTGAYMIPGVGMESVLDLSDPEQPYSRPRDLWREQEVAQELAEDLGLDRMPRHGPNDFILADVQRALGLIEALKQSRLRERCLIEWPKNGAQSLEGKLELGDKLEEQAISIAIGEPQDWFQVKGQVEVQGESLRLEELLAALKKQRRFIQLPSGKWATITDVFRKRMEAVQGVLEEDQEEVFVSPGQAEELERQVEQDNIQIEQASQAWWRLKKRIVRKDILDENPPRDFKATLRPYQLEGFRWLHRLAVWGMGACLADDMGLGKTIQTLAILQKHARKGPSLVVAPVSVASNWQKECEKFCPNLQAMIYRDRDRQDLLDNLMPEDILITSYGLLLRDVEYLKEVDWNCLILDEAQSIKNAKSKTAKAVQSLSSQWTLALSGTPIENHLGDLWSLFRTINPGLLGSWERFKRSYGFPISRDNSEEARARLEKRIKPFILRRLKKDHLKELPPKSEINLDVEMSSDEMDVYQAIRLEAVQKIEGGDEGQTEAQKRVAILGALTRLRQAACHPKLVMDTWNDSSSKLELFASLAEQVHENRHKALVFSQFTSHLALVREKLDDLGYTYAYLDGSTPVTARQRQVDAFQEGGLDFFLISLKAGGTGITLTEADFVIHMDPWWNPAVEDQATDRAYRIGQTKPVTVYRLVSRGTVEDMILNVHREKRQLAASLLEHSDKVGSLGSQDLMALIQS